MKKRIAYSLVLGLAALAPAAAQARTLKVVASFTIVADMARTIGGDKVEVATLVGPNGDPHTFEPSPSDAQKLKSADLVVVNGLGLEGWLERLIKASGFNGRTVVASADVKPLKTVEDGHPALDPHAWNDAGNGILYVQAITRGMTAADPADAATFAANAKAYEAKLTALDAEARREIASLTPAQRKILTTHDALGYFAKAYNVEILSPLGISTEQEAAAGSVAGLIDQIKREHVKTYFLENSNDPRLIEQIARATGAKPGGELYVESLSPAGGPATTYPEMFRFNLNQMLGAMRAQS